MAGKELRREGCQEHKLNYLMEEGKGAVAGKVGAGKGSPSWVRDGAGIHLSQKRCV